MHTENENNFLLDHIQNYLFTLRLLFLLSPHEDLLSNNTFAEDIMSPESFSDDSLWRFLIWILKGEQAGMTSKWSGRGRKCLYSLLSPVESSCYTVIPLPGSAVYNEPRLSCQWFCYEYFSAALLNSQLLPHCILLILICYQGMMVTFRKGMSWKAMFLAQPTSIETAFLANMSQMYAFLNVIADSNVFHVLCEKCPEYADLLLKQIRLRSSLFNDIQINNKICRKLSRYIRFLSLIDRDDWCWKSSCTNE